MPKINLRFDHLHIVCFDLQEMIRFWTEALGGKLVARRSFDSVAGAVIDLDGVAIYLRLPKSDERIVLNGGNTSGYHHVGIFTDNLSAAKRRLIDFGGHFISSNVDGTTVFFQGPENILVELKTNK